MRPHRIRFLFGITIGWIIASMLLILPTPTHAAPTFVVNSPADIPASSPLNNGVCETAPGNGVCTLRAAIMKANHYPGGGATINFGLPGTVTYTLAIAPSGTDDESTGDLNITNTMTIVGNGATNTIIDGNSIDRVFNIAVTMTISSLTVTNGKTMYSNTDPNAFAGGILANYALTLTNSIVSRNSAIASTGAAYGGGIYSSGHLVLINSSVISNSVNTTSGIASGGGIVGSGTLSSSTISGNTARDSGGGIYGSGTLINSTVSENTARNGGGINGGVLTLINSTVSGNHANDNGGGIYHSGSTMNLYNVTITGNLANAKASGIAAGGGIANASGTINFQNTIIGNNLNVLIINGFPVLNPEDCSGTLTSQGYNIMSETSDCTVTGSVAFTNPNLGPLANNGGPTQTHALLHGSPAIDAGNPGGCTDNLGATLTTDQRGVHRPAFGGIALRCDMGAYELQQMIFLPLILR